MDTLVEIVKNVSISPVYMNKNIIKAIITILKEKYEKSCNEDDGMIVSIDGIKKLDNIISKDSRSINFTVTFVAKVVKPCVNVEFEFIPNLILQKGVFGKIYDNINLFIPDNKLVGWTFNEGNFKKGKKMITKESSIKVIVTDIKFNNTKYNCICKLVEK